VATVICPLVQVYGKPLDVAPYGVILKPSHGLKILRRESRRGFSPQAEYIFRKQLEEADFILINKVDELGEEVVDELKQLLIDEFPDRDVLGVSARTGLGFPALIEVLSRRGNFGTRNMEVDYDVYAAGEAELGWLNCQIVATSDSSFDLDTLLLDLVARLHVRLVASESESAHVKAIGMSDGTYAVANLVSNQSGPELSLASRSRVTTANLVLNARVATDPQALEAVVREEVAAACAAVDSNHTITNLQSFRPGRPVPTHRLAN
jgi:hypothetical protein